MVAYAPSTRSSGPALARTRNSGCGARTVRAPSSTPSRWRHSRRPSPPPPAAAPDAASPPAWGDLFAQPRTRLPTNVDGRFYVDSHCINCDVCRRLAPASFGVAGRQSAVLAQPAPGGETDAAFRALVSCPTGSIHITDKDPAAIQAAIAEFPQPVDGVPSQADGGPPALFLGLTSAKSFGASSYLLLRPGGNVMVDVPRFNARLAARLKSEYGGVAAIFLTHRDDVGDHAEWARALGAPRVLHAAECSADQGTDAVEVKLTGDGPWRLPDGGADVALVLQRGHTEACVCLHHAPSATLFSGDVLMGPTPGHAWGDAALVAARDFCWHSFAEQLASLAALADDGRYPFRHVVPGHGRPTSFGGVEEARAALKDLVARERAASA